MWTETDQSLDLVVFLSPASFIFSIPGDVVDDEDFRFLVVLGCEFFLLCLFGGLPVNRGVDLLDFNPGRWLFIFHHFLLLSGLTKQCRQKRAKDSDNDKC